MTFSKHSGNTILLVTHLVRLVCVYSAPQGEVTLKEGGIQPVE